MLRTRTSRSSVRRPGARSFPLCHRRVEALEELSPGVFLLSVERGAPFQPGQTIALAADASGPSRYYSIASGRADRWTQVLFDLVPDGALTPRLAGLLPGDSIYLSAPFGTFVDEDGPTMWIATGTGVAPFVSMVRTLEAAPLGQKTLIHGSRTASCLHFRGLLASALGERYLPCCSGQEEAGAYRGRVTSWLADHELPRSSRYMLCGSSTMVVEAREILMSRGVPLRQIAAEIYF